MKKCRGLILIILTLLLSLLFVGCGEKNLDTSREESEIQTNGEEIESEIRTGIINIGDYIQFGKYNDEPILWKCVDTANGSMLVTENIITTKAFDAAESGIHGQILGTYTTDEGKQRYGSNEWHNSNLREWLNSASKVVNYTTQPPTKDAVYNGYNPYADEPGLLTNFTESEKEKIKEVLHDGVKDKVYILSEDEVNKYIGSTNDERVKHLTEKARLNSDYSISHSNWRYWTRTPSALMSTISLHSVHNVGHIYPGGATVGYMGVVVALNLQPETTLSGNGTREKPYIVQ